MNSRDKREKLGNEIIMLGESILQDEEIVGTYDAVKNELRVECSLGGTSSMIIIVKNYKKLGVTVEDWPDYIG